MTFYHYGNRHRVKQRDLGEYPAPPQESGTRRFCESGYGVCDMCGNLWEWTTQPAIEQYCRYSDPAKRLLLGGCGGFDGYAPSCNDMTGNEMTYSCETFGFRCCRDAD
ncbi:MAG: SUMF1/EgtB/PvdO family nonheme iron enzyme, partial [Candidatus Coatesbacteria bacterium]|nr:SUMF1/EgtB/PvdO family nonheme iron enzyme [Candidatus Coatesbacteria bacterium]